MELLIQQMLAPTFLQLFLMILVSSVFILYHFFLCILAIDGPVTNFNSG